MDPLQGLKPSVVCLSPLKWVEPFCISKPPHAREEENDRKLLGGPEEEGVYEYTSKKTAECFIGGPYVVIRTNVC